MKMAESSFKPVEKDNLVFLSKFSFPKVFSKDLYCRHVKTRACLGKGYERNSPFFLKNELCIEKGDYFQNAFYKAKKIT